MEDELKREIRELEVKIVERDDRISDLERALDDINDIVRKHI